MCCMCVFNVIVWFVRALVCDGAWCVCACVCFIVLLMWLILLEYVCVFCLGCFV